MANILLVDDDSGMLRMMREALTSKEHSPTPCGSAEEALSLLQKKSFDLLISDIKLPGMDGLSLLQEAHKVQSDLPVIVITAFGSVDIAVNAMKMGAVDFMTKPFPLDELDIKVEKALEQTRRFALSVYLREELQDIFGKFVGETSKMKEIYSVIQKVAQGRSTVLIRGESGTGKELVARAIHELSPWKKEPFIKVNCMALAPGVLESELFGHEKGAFTGAMERRKGRFELAHQGTLFLDEVGDLDALLQVKLLRVIQEREFERVGSSEPIHVDVRLVTATHQDLEKRIQEGKFRQDLYYRLNVVSILLPPLRERLEDMSALVQTFVEIANRNANKSVKGISPEVIEKLKKYHWPGNGRELQNVVERAVVLSAGDFLKPGDFILENRSSPQAFKIAGNLNESLDSFEKEQIVEALNAADWTQVKAAALLGITRTALQYKMKKYELEPPPRIRMAGT